MERLRGKSNRGYTLAEVLLVVGIITIVAAFGFVSAITYQKKLNQKELDSTAQEIFLAAQNHLSTVYVSGKWQKFVNENSMQDVDGNTTYPSGIFGKQASKAPADSTGYDVSNLYYITVTDGDCTQSELLEILLPFGAIDQTLLDEGKSMLIEYDILTGNIYGVWYTNDTDVTGDKLTECAYGDKDLRTDSADRTDSGITVGYYGGAAATADNNAGTSSGTLKVEIQNNNSLTLYIYDKISIDGDDSTIEDHVTKVTLKGLKSGAECIIGKSELTLSTDEKQYQYVLDSITAANKHFARFTSENSYNFIPGEDIQVIVSASINGLEISKSAANNSLFAYSEEDETGISNSSVTIANERHLQNLSEDISATAFSELGVTEAVLADDIDWSAFITDKTLYDKDNTDRGENFVSIYNKNLKVLNGNQFSISKISIASDSQGNCGLIGTAEDIEVKNLNLVSPTVAGVGKSTGAIVGEATGDVVLDNCKVSFSTSKEINATTAAGGVIGSANGDSVQISGVTLSADSDCYVKVIAKEGSAGGLVGSVSADALSVSAAYAYGGSDSDLVSGYTNAGGLIGEITAKTVTMETCAESFYVTASTGSAGGLVGSLTATTAATISESMSGGRTTSDKNAGDGTSASSHYVASTDASQQGHYNVISSGATGSAETACGAGGFIGIITSSSKSVAISNSYSTASAYSVNGMTAGGFIGTEGSDSVTVSYCYATGMVGSTNAGNAGCFVGYNKGATGTENYFLSGINKTVQRACGSGTEIAKKVTSGTKNTPLVGGGTTAAIVYNEKLASKSYSYTSAAGITHIGDWPFPAGGKKLKVEIDWGYRMYDNDGRKNDTYTDTDVLAVVDGSTDSSDTQHVKGSDGNYSDGRTVTVALYAQRTDGSADPVELTQVTFPYTVEKETEEESTTQAKGLTKSVTDEPLLTAPADSSATDATETSTEASTEAIKAISTLSNGNAALDLGTEDANTEGDNAEGDTEEEEEETDPYAPDAIDGNPWSCKWEDLPETDDAGYELEYYVVELGDTEVKYEYDETYKKHYLRPTADQGTTPGGQMNYLISTDITDETVDDEIVRVFSISNVEEHIRIGGSIEWIDLDAENRPTSVTLFIMKNGKYIGGTTIKSEIPVSEDTGWTYDYGYKYKNSESTYVDFPMYDTEGNINTYEIRERAIQIKDSEGNVTDWYNTEFLATETNRYTFTVKNSICYYVSYHSDNSKSSSIIAVQSYSLDYNESKHTYEYQILDATKVEYDVKRNGTETVVAWSEDVEGSSDSAVCTYKSVAQQTYVTRTIDLYPVWGATYKVKFVTNVNGVVIDTITVAADELLTSEKPTPTFEGLTFEDWYTSASLQESTRFNGWGTAITQDYTLYAKWDMNDTIGYTIAIWKQKATDERDLDISKRSYDYVGSFNYVSQEITSGMTSGSGSTLYSTLTKQGMTLKEFMNSSETHFSDYVNSSVYGGTNTTEIAGVSLEGFYFNGTHAELSDNSIVVKIDGSTIINIYYERCLYDIVFTTPSEVDDVYFTRTVKGRVKQNINIYNETNYTDGKAYCKIETIPAHSQACTVSVTEVKKKHNRSEYKYTLSINGTSYDISENGRIYYNYQWTDLWTDLWETTYGWRGYRVDERSDLSNGDTVYIYVDESTEYMYYVMTESGDSYELSADSSGYAYASDLGVNLYSSESADSQIKYSTLQNQLYSESVTISVYIPDDSVITVKYKITYDGTAYELQGDDTSGYYIDTGTDVYYLYASKDATDTTLIKEEQWKEQLYGYFDIDRTELYDGENTNMTFYGLYNQPFSVYSTYEWPSEYIWWYTYTYGTGYYNRYGTCFVSTGQLTGLTMFYFKASSGTEYEEYDSSSHTYTLKLYLGCNTSRSGSWQYSYTYTVKTNPYTTDDSGVKKYSYPIYLCKQLPHETSLDDAKKHGYTNVYYNNATGGIYQIAATFATNGGGSFGVNEKFIGYSASSYSTDGTNWVTAEVGTSADYTNQLFLGFDTKQYTIFYCSNFFGDMVSDYEVDAYYDDKISDFGEYVLDENTVYVPNTEYSESVGESDSNPKYMTVQDYAVNVMGCSTENITSLDGNWVISNNEYLTSDQIEKLYLTEEDAEGNETVLTFRSATRYYYDKQSDDGTTTRVTYLMVINTTDSSGNARTIYINSEAEKFMGWYADPSGTAEFNFDSKVPDSNVIIYGYWSLPKIVISYDTVPVNVNDNYTLVNSKGKSDEYKSVAIHVNTTTELQEPSTPVRPDGDNCLFKGWYYKETDSEGNTVYTLANFGKRYFGNTTIYAVWADVETNYKVVYHNENSKYEDVPYGTVTNEESTYLNGASVRILNYELTDDNVNFTGWNTEKDGSGKVYLPGLTYVIDGNDEYFNTASVDEYGNVIIDLYPQFTD